MQAFIEKARQDEREDGLKNALAAFYLKSATAAENSVEFFHKSFGEFLCAKRVAKSLEYLTEKTGKRRKTYVVSDEEFEWRVYDLFGYGNLTVEVVEYLMALLVKSQVDLVVLFERLHGFYLDWCDGKFIEATQETLPQKKGWQLQQWGIESGQRRVDIYTGLNVMILLFELHRYGRSQEGLREQLHFYPCGKPDSEDFEETKLLRTIGYGECLGNGAFVNTVGKFFRGSDLSDANFIGVKLVLADLSDANLSGANLIGANLIGADLSDANLSDANLSDANLSDADLSDANLSGANLSNANLSDAKWNNNTQWLNSINLHEAVGVSKELRQHPKFVAALVQSKSIRNDHDIMFG
ncbi:MAG: pentapeptide repeat-containing protein [Okeania sp. SIO2D1]|nr:pentapeptide repeat-containing protein [Okeania sp. SIO2D1]